MKTMKYICVCLLIGQIFITPALSYAEELKPEVINAVTEDSEIPLLLESEDTSNQLETTSVEEQTSDSSVKSENNRENVKHQFDETTTDENVLQKSNDIKSSELEQKEFRETRAGISSMWGTSPVTLDEETGILTVEAGTLSTYTGENIHDLAPKVKKIILKDGVKAPEDSAYLFAGYSNVFINLISISGVLDTSDVTNMGSMFQSSKNLVSIDVSDWDVSKVDRLDSMFEGASSLTNIDVSNWDLGNVTSMDSMFEGASSLTNIDVSNWDVGNVTGMDSMFEGASSLTNIDVSNWDVGNVTSMDSMFRATRNLVNLDLSMWDVKNVRSMYGMFSEVSGLENLDVSGWDTSKITNLYSVFHFEEVPFSITLGERSIFGDDTGIPYIVYDGYTKRWERANPSSSISVYDTSSSLMREYDGSMPGTYTWQRPFTVKDSVIYTGDSWFKYDNLIPAKNSKGETDATTNIQVEGVADTSTAGEYEIMYKNGSFSKTAKVTVKENKTTLEVKDSILYVGEKWESQSNLVSATDRDGNELVVDDLEVQGAADTSTAGEYEITYKNGNLSKTAKVTVKENKTTLEVKDSILYVGEKWESQSNLISATDRDGNELVVDDLEVQGA
ncbi:BspA family leucine-rich repeat surface protein, partial [Listeria monocytogenes]|nr:BspA family leucine-rich repeat surface protein [Listeria monocytogenes]